MNVLFIPLLAVGTAAPDAVTCNYEGHTTMEMRACAARDFGRADIELNDVYGRLIQTLPSAERGRLRKEQRAWLARRDPTCEHETESERGGTVRPQMFMHCQQRLTRDRTAELREMLAAPAHSPK